MPGAPNEAGYTLLELMIALMILAIGILGIWSMQGTAIRGNAQAKRITEGAALAADQVEKLMRMEYDDADLATGTHSRVEDSYTVQWTVSAADVPINNIKTVDVTASWTVTGQTRSVSYVYYKADQM
jgi:type IV pilus modification protein PilV